MLIWMRCYQAIKFLFQKLILGHEYRLFFLHIFWLWKEPFNVGLQLLQLMFKMTAVRLHTCLESHTPFFQCFVHDTLIKLIPLLHKTLFEMINVLQSASVHTLLQNTPDLVVNWVEIWTVRRPVQWTDEAWSWALQQCNCLSCPVSWCAVLLEDVIISRNISDSWQEMLGQQDVSVVCTIDFNARLDEDERCAA